MKKIYILTAVLALLTLSLNAQLKANKNKAVQPSKAPTEKVVTPSDGCKMFLQPVSNRAPRRAATYTLLNDEIDGSKFSTDVNISTSAPWTATSVRNQSGGVLYIRSGGSLVFTVPSGYTNANFKFVFKTSTSYYNGYFTFTPSTGSAQQVTTSAASTEYECELTGLSTGNTVTITGIYTGYSYSPDFMYMYVYVPIETSELTVCSGNYYAESLPVYGYFYDEAEHNQMVYPASLLGTSMVGKPIKSMTFYPTTGTYTNSSTGTSTNYSGMNFYGGSVIFKMMNLSSGTAAFAEQNPTLITGTMTQVATVTPVQNTSATTWVITFNQDFVYNGGDLLIDVTSTDGNYSHSFFTVDAVDTYRGAYNVSYNGTNYSYGTNYLPKVTFTYEGAADPVHDLGIALSAQPTLVGTGGTITLTATVTNNGNQTETGYTVNFTAGGTTISTQTGGTLNAGETATFTAQYTPTQSQAGQTVNFGASVTCTDDADATNDNATASSSVVSLPPPENVAATGGDNSGTMTWNAPSSIPTFAESVTESFENGTNGWTFIDADGDGHNWIWHDNSTATSNMITNTGSCLLYSESYYNETNTILYPNNWLISPEVVLDGTFSLYACGQDANGYHNEVFGVYVCVGSYNGTSNFQQVGADVTTTHNMTQYTYDLSQYQGQTGYIAIVHHNVSDQFILNIDDITYNSPVIPEILSYNVYLDGQLVGNVDANTFSYTFNNVASGEHQCAVSAVYDFGESAAVPTTFSTLPKTDAPTISVTEGATSYTITATATDPSAAVTLVVDGVTYTGTGSVSTTIERGTDDQTVAVSATAQEQGKLVSDPATRDVTVPALPITPTPTITYEQTAATVVITATGEGIITLTAGGQTVTGEGPISITIMRSIEDQTVSATATAVATNHQPSASANASVPVPALTGGPAEALEGLLRMHLLVVDQFKENIPDDNSHPEHYGYVLKYEPNGPNGTGVKESGTVQVDIKKTEAQVNGYYTLTQVENDIDHDNSEITLDVLSADVGMFLPGEDPDVLYYQMQGTKDANPALGQDYLTQLQYMKNIQKYEEMLETSPDKTHRYNANETYHYFDDSTPIVTGAYGQNFMTYAPSVSTWGIQRRYFETDGLDNTYGAPIWKTGVGQVRVIHTEAQLQRGPQGSTQWDGVGGPCSLVFLGVEAFGDLPSVDVSNILYEPYMFRVWVQSPGNNLRGCNLVAKGVDPDKPGEHWTGDGTSYGADPVLVYEGLTTDGILYKHVQPEEEGNNVDWGEKIQFGALDSGISDLIVYVRFYYRSTGRGINNSNRLMLRGEGDDDDDTPEVPGYYAVEGNDDPQITTGIMGVYTDLSKPVESVTYVNAQGMQSSKPFDGVNIVITRYTDGTTSTRKVVR